MIQYKVKARLARNIGSDKFELEEFEKVFHNEKKPIEATMKAFGYFESILDIINADSNDEFSIMRSLESPLYDYFIRKGDLEPPLKIPESFPDNLEVGLYFSNINDDEVLNAKQNDYFIMGWNGSSYNTDENRKNLELEKKIYDLNNWDTKDWITTIKYYDFSKSRTQYINDPEAIILSEVLWTPTDFWTYSNPSAFVEDDGITAEEIEEDFKIIAPKKEATLIDKIIKQGENRNLEFKSTLRYCKKTNKPQKYIEHSVVKTICALANTAGGILLIGVSDTGDVLGLNDDIHSFRSKSQDSFLKHFDNLIRDYFTEPIDAILKYGFEETHSQTIFMIQVEESNKPRFLVSKKKEKEFYIRRSASTVSLDIQEAVNYTIDKWFTNKNENQ